jgi:hypothetical protein
MFLHFALSGLALLNLYANPFQRETLVSPSTLDPSIPYHYNINPGLFQRSLYNFYIRHCLRQTAGPAKCESASSSRAAAYHPTWVPTEQNQHYIRIIATFVDSLTISHVKTSFAAFQSQDLSSQQLSWAQLYLPCGLWLLMRTTQRSPWMAHQSRTPRPRTGWTS